MGAIQETRDPHDPDFVPDPGRRTAITEMTMWFAAAGCTAMGVSAIQDALKSGTEADKLANAVNPPPDELALNEAIKAMRPYHDTYDVMAAAAMITGNADIVQSPDPSNSVVNEATMTLRQQINNELTRQDLLRQFYFWQLNLVGIASLGVAGLWAWLAMKARTSE